MPVSRENVTHRTSHTVTGRMACPTPMHTCCKPRATPKHHLVHLCARHVPGSNDSRFGVKVTWVPHTVPVPYFKHCTCMCELWRFLLFTVSRPSAQSLSTLLERWHCGGAIVVWMSMTGFTAVRSATQKRFLRDTVKLPRMHVVARTVTGKSMSQPELLRIEIRFQAPCNLSEDGRCAAWHRPSARQGIFLADLPK